MPKSLQWNKSILLKALDAANSSIQSSNNRKQYENNNNNNEKSSNSSVKLRLGSLTKNDENKKNYSKISFQGNERIEETVEMHSSISTSSNNNNNSEISSTTTINRRTIELNNEENNNIDTKFIVTLKGVNEKDFLFKKIDNDDDLSNNNNDSNDEHNVSIKRRLGNLNDVDEDEAMIVNEEDEEDRIQLKVIKFVYWPSCGKGGNCPYLQPNKQFE